MKITNLTGKTFAVAGLCLLTTTGMAQQQNPATGNAPAADPAESAAQATNRQMARSIWERAHIGPKGEKSAQVEFTIDIASSDSGAASLSLKMTRVGKQYRMELTPIGEGIGELGREARKMRMLVVSDGKAEYALTGQEYTKRAASSRSSLLFLGDSTIEPCDLLPPVTLNGQTAYVVRSRVGDKDNSIVMLSYINQNTYQIMKFEAGNDVANSGFNIVAAIKSEVFNRDVPESLFKFTPPHGAKQIPATADAAANPLQIAMLGMAGSGASHKP